MKTMLLSGVAIALIAIGANLALQDAGLSTRDVTTGPNVRLGG
ncbi:hypothetical protein [Brevirhabdus sp.]